MKIIEFLLFLLSRQQALAVGSFLGACGYYIFRKRRKLAINNLYLSIGKHYTEKKIKKIIYQLFQHLGMSFIEFFRFSEINENNLSEFVTFHGREILDQAYAQKNGVLILSAHIGNWEVLTSSLSLSGYHGAAISKTVRQNFLNNYLTSYRKLKNINILSGKRITKSILKILKSGGLIGIVLDQYGVKSESVSIPFFGRPANTLKSLAVFALRTQSPVIPIYTYRDNHHHHHIMIEPPILISPQDTIESCTLKFNQFLESAIRKHPEQWIWTHNRWKNNE